MSQSTQDEDAPPVRVGMRKFRGNMTDYLRQVRDGASFLITSRNEVVAELRPPSLPKPPRRLLGAMRGQIWMADDFDAWPDGFIEAMEEGDIFPATEAFRNSGK